MILYGTNPIAWSNDDDTTIGAHLSLDDCLSDCRRIGFDGIEKGVEDIFPDPMSQGMADGWHNGSTKGLERELAAMYARFTQQA